MMKSEFEGDMDLVPFCPMSKLASSTSIMFCTGTKWCNQANGPERNAFSFEIEASTLFFFKQNKPNIKYQKPVLLSSKATAVENRLSEGRFNGTPYQPEKSEIASEIASLYLFPDSKSILSTQPSICESQKLSSVSYHVARDLITGI